jgi:OOP family OmpA-OmpF porin
MNKQIAMVVTLVCASSLALAQAKPQQNAGWYAGASGGRSATDFTTQDFSTNAYTALFPASAGLIAGSSTDDRNTAWRLFVGYNFDKNWALEGAYTSLGEGKYTLTGAGGVYAGGANTYTVDNNSWSLAVKGTLPVSKEFDIFALLGGTSNYSKTNMGATGRFAVDLATAGASRSKTRGYGMGGLGVEYKPTPKIGIRAEYHNYGKFGDKISNANDNTGRTEVDAWLLGVSFKF